MNIRERGMSLSMAVKENAKQSLPVDLHLAAVFTSSEKAILTRTKNRKLRKHGIYHDKRKSTQIRNVLYHKVISYIQNILKYNVQTWNEVEDRILF